MIFMNKRKKIKYLKNILRGYRLKFNQKELSNLRNLLDTLKDSDFSFIKKKSYLNQYPDLYHLSDIIAKQYLFDQTSLKIENAYFEFYGKKKEISIPLPMAWLNLLQASGIKVNFFSSRLNFVYYIFFISLKNIYKDILLLLNLLTYNKDKSNSDFIYVNGLSFKKFFFIKKENFTLFNWFISKFSKSINFKYISHNIKDSFDVSLGGKNIKYLPYPWLISLKLEQKISLFFYWIKSLFVLFSNLIRGRWWFGLMFAELTKARLVSLLEKECLALHYFFSWNGDQYRPIWTYVAESKGINFSLIFNSVSSEPLSKYDIGIRSPLIKLSTWSHVYAWTNQHKAKILEAYIIKPKITTSGPIYYIDSDANIPKLKKPGIAVFPIQPHRTIFYRGISSYYDWFSDYPNIYLDFLSNINDVLCEFNICMLLKEKRNIQDRLPKKFIKFKRELNNNSNTMILDENISPLRICLSSIGSISMPFTSTALMIPYKDYSSVYYDPTGYIKNNDPAANGIKLISRKTELKNWVASLLHN